MLCHCGAFWLAEEPLASPACRLASRESKLKDGRRYMYRRWKVEFDARWESLPWPSRWVELVSVAFHVGFGKFP